MIRIFTSKPQKTGEHGENQAVQYLLKQGFSIVERNVPNKFGEIDIVAKKGGVHYFFEVKAGKYGGTVNPAENLTPLKIRKFLVSVQHYCLLNRVTDYRVQGILVLQKHDGTCTVETIDIV